MKKRPLLFVVAIFLLLGVFFYFSKNKKEKNVVFTYTNEEQILADKFHSALHIDKEFYGNLGAITPSNSTNEIIYGGIVSHHFLVADEIANFFSAFQKHPPKVIAIVGPNHYSVGDGDILVSNYAYQTPWGIAEPEKKYIDELLSRNVVYHDEAPFAREHSISALVGFIKYYLPDTKIIPIIVKRTVANKKTEILAQSLNEILPDDAVVIASADFSHHLNKIASQFHDERSASAIKSFDYSRVLNSEIDSPSSVYTLLRYLELRGAQKMIYKNVNSADFIGNNVSDDVTSYLFAHFTKGNYQADDKISVLSFGDMMFERELKKAVENGINPLEKIRGPEGNFLRGVDFISSNLEGPITESDDCLEKEYSFKFNPKTAKLIAKNGINIVNLANNHSEDCNNKGLEDTVDYLLKNRINFFGSFSADNNYIEKEVNGKKVVFMGIDITTHSVDLSREYESIKNLKEYGNYVVVNIHWGYEYHDNPSRTQKDIGHALIDNGADLIIGHHPHIIQPVEIYKNKAIFYSLGNFIFDQAGPKTNEGIGVGTVFDNEDTKYFLFPYNIKNYQPTLLLSKQAMVFCDNYLSNIQNRNGCEFEISSK